MKCEWPVITRCCFCLPLRKGLLAIGYFKLIYSAIMVGVYSVAIHKGKARGTLLLHGFAHRMASELCLVLFLMELVSCALLLYGTHMKVPRYLRIYFYYGLVSSTVIILAGIIQFLTFTFDELLLFGYASFFTGIFFMELYLLTILWNVMKKMNVAEGQRENPLQHFISATV